MLILLPTASVAYGVGCGLLLLAAVFFLVTNLIPIDESVLKKQPFFELLRTPGSSQIVMLILMVTVIPLVEEFLFRGAMFSALARGKGIAVATIVTTLLFMAVYIPEKIHYWPGFIAVGLLGLVSVALRLRFFSLVPSVITHAVYNAILLGTSFLYQSV